jgi:hypothetical protein
MRFLIFFSFMTDSIQPGKGGAIVHAEDWPLLLKVGINFI